ncbi:MAG: hypothetical protein WA962_06665 [Ornithinimicrobium sp.]
MGASPTRPNTTRPEGYVVPSRTDPVVRMASNAIGGPLGRYAVVGARGRAGVAAGVIVMGAAMLALGVFQKGHCVVKGWVDPDQFWRACYSDVTVVNVSSALANRSLPYSGAAPSDQPLGAGLVMWALSLMSPHSGGDLVAQQWIFGLWAAVAMILMSVCVVGIVAMRPSRPWQSAHFAVSPVIAVLALISVDLGAVALVIWALWCWQRAHPLVAGVLLGMAFLFRPYPLIFLVAMVLVAWRQDQVRRAAQVSVAAVASAVGIYLPFLLVLGEPLLLAPRQWLSSAPGYGGVSLVPNLNGLSVSTSAATTIALSGWVSAAVVGWWLARHRAPVPRRCVAEPARDRPGDVSFVVALAAPMMLIVMVTATSVSVQTGLWVLPFLALSTLPWRDHLIWAAVEIVHFEAVWLYIGFGSDPGRGLPGDAYSLTIVARALAWTWVLLRVWGTRHAADEAQPALQRSPVTDPITAG